MLLVVPSRSADVLFRIAMAWRICLQNNYQDSTSGIIVLVATLLTVAGQSIRAAMANPAKSLKDK